jgi:bifunctional enzyme CysN/CysC
VQDGDIVAGCIIERTGVDADRRIVGPCACHDAGPAITEPEREARYGHSGGVVWLTGLSGAGKSTLARALDLTTEAITESQISVG